MEIATCIRADLDPAEVERAVLESAAAIGLRRARADETPHRAIDLRASHGARGWIITETWTSDTLARQIIGRLDAPALALVLDLDQAQGFALVLRGAEELQALAFDGSDALRPDRWVSCFGAIDADALRAASLAEDPADWLDALASAVGIAPPPFSGASQTLAAQLGRMQDTLSGFLQHATTVLQRGNVSPMDFARPPEEPDPDVTMIDLCFTDELMRSVLASGPPDFSWSFEGTRIGDDADLSDEELDVRYRRGEDLHDVARAFQRAMSDFGRAFEEGDDHLDLPAVPDTGASGPGPWRVPLRVGARGLVRLEAINTGGALTGVVIELDGPALRDDRLRVRVLRVSELEMKAPRRAALPLRFELSTLTACAGLIGDRGKLECLGPCTDQLERSSILSVELEIDGLVHGESELHVWIAPLAGGPKRLCRARVTVDLGR